MTGHYKDVGERYAYQRELESKGFERMEYLTFGCGSPSEKELNPEVFYNNYQPEKSDAMEWRKAIKRFIQKEIKELEGKKYRIVKAVGYWRDLWLFVYEVWVKA